MERQSLIDEKQKITLADEKSGVLKVDLIQVVGRGGTAIAYKGIRYFNGEKQMCIIKEYFPFVYDIMLFFTHISFNFEKFKARMRVMR